jgi:uncharacterized DUF497 family protein
VDTSFQYDFEWDPDKSISNHAQHDITFERAATVFLNAKAISDFEIEHSGEEDHWITLGLDRNGILLVVHHSFRE